MKRILPAIILSLILASCTTMPAEIDEKYLGEKTEPQSKTIFTLEQKIIEKNKQKQDIEQKGKVQAKLPAGTDEEIRLLKKENGVLKDQVYYYEKNKDAVNLESKKTQLAENETSIAKKTILLQYQQSEKNLLDAERDLKDAELAEYIAELNVEKAKIASAYRDKNETPKPEEKQNFFTKFFNKKDPNDRYGYKKYGEYAEKKKQDTSKAEAKYREAEKNFNDARAGLEKSK